MNSLAIFATLTIVDMAILTDVYGAEITGEVIVKAATSEAISTETESFGTLFVKMTESADAVSDLQVRFGDRETAINVASVKLLLPMTDIIIGRQIFSWGSGYNFNPTDIFNDRPLGASFDPSYTKRGRDALAVNFYPLQNLSLELIYAAPYSLEKSLKSQKGVGSTFEIRIPLLKH